MVAVALVLLGGGAAVAARDAYGAQQPIAAARCLAERGIEGTTLRGVDSAWQQSPAIREQVEGCVAANAQDQSRFMVLGAVLLPVMALLLMIGGGLAVRWRLPRSAGSPAERMATQRFEDWCERLGLTGRRRPRMVITPPAASGRQAFTTGLPFSSPVVVVPVGHAYLPQARFDVLILHELAHVRARDVLWASAVWWTGWLAVPLMVVALSPLVRWPQQQAELLAAYVPSLVLAVALSAVVLALRSALLRRREIAADRYAADVLGSTDALRACLNESARVVGPIRRWLGLHPPHATRADLDRAAPDRWEGGFAVTAAAGVLSMFMVQSAYTVLSSQEWAWRSGRLSLVAAVAAGSLVWACVVVPAWRRRAGIAAAAGRSASWSGPVSGAVLGTVVGFLTQVPGAATGVWLGLAHGLFAGHVALSAGVVAAVAAGTAVLTAGLAAVPPAAGRAARTWSAVAATVAVATAWTTAFATSILVLVIYLPSGSLGRARTFMTGAGLLEWQWAPTLVLVGCAVVALTRRRDVADPPRARNRWRVPAALLVPGLAVTAGGGAAGLIWQLRIGAADSDDALFVLMSQRSMICAFAGWVVLAVLLAVGRREPVRALPAAVAAGFVTAALAGVLLFGIAAAGGRGRSVDTLVAAVRWPMWQLLVAVVLTLPVLVAVVGRVRHPAAGLGAGVAVAVFGVALAGGAVPGLAAGPHDWSDYVTSLGAAPAVPAVRPSPPASGPAGRADPGRPLDDATVTVALSGVDQLLPAGNRKLPDEADNEEPLDVRPEACRAALIHASTVERARPRSADVAHKFKTALGPYDNVSVDVGVVSYRTPIEDFRLDREAIAGCARLTMPIALADTGVAHGTYGVGVPPDVPYPGLRTDFTLTASIRTQPIVTTWVAEYALVRHNVVSVGITMSSSGGPPTEAARRERDELAETMLTYVIDRLRHDPPK